MSRAKNVLEEEDDFFGVDAVADGNRDDELAKMLADADRLERDAHEMAHKEREARIAEGAPRKGTKKPKVDESDDDDDDDDDEPRPKSKKQGKKRYESDSDDDVRPRGKKEITERDLLYPPKKEQVSREASRRRYIYHCFAKIKEASEALRRKGIITLFLYKPENQARGMNLLPCKKPKRRNEQLSAFRFNRMSDATQNLLHRMMVSLARDFPEEELA